MHAYKRGDASDVGNYRPLTIMSCVAKLFSSLLVQRLLRVVSLHDQQYAFRPGRGTLNALHSLVDTIQARTEQGLLTYVCFFDAEKAYDAVPHGLLLYRLLQKGVTGKAFRVIAGMYAHARSCVRVGSSLSAAFSVQRGVAQGCPLSPLLYAVFIDSVLDHIYGAEMPPGGEVMVGAGGWRRPFRGQLYADDLAALAASAAGMQCLLDATYRHSRQCDWTASLLKTKVVVFGPARIPRGEPAFLWGGERLRVAPSERYLGLHLTTHGDWGPHAAAAAAKGRAALHKWRPVLRSWRVPADVKRLVLHTRVAPCLWYGMEVWPVPRGETLLDRVMMAAARLAAGVYGCAAAPAFIRWRGVNPDVLRSDMRVLLSRDVCRLAHSRHRVRVHSADADAREAGPVAAASPAPNRSLAADAPDFLGAAVRSAPGPWLARADHSLFRLWRACPDPAAPVPPVRPPSRYSPLRLPAAADLCNARLRAGAHALALLDRGVAGSGAAPRGDRLGRARRLARRASTCRNPLSRGLLLGAVQGPRYTAAASPVVHVLMCIRSSHLPGDYRCSYGGVDCPWVCGRCGCQVYDPHEDFGAQATVESRWRHVEHLLLECPAAVPACAPALPVHLLRDDLLQAAGDSAGLRAAILAAFPGCAVDVECASALSVPFLLDPVVALCGDGPLRGRAVHDCVRLVASFVLGVACGMCGEPALDLARATRPALSVPFPARVAGLLPSARSAAQDSVAASCSLVDGVCVCDESALGGCSSPQGAVADARTGRA